MRQRPRKHVRRFVALVVFATGILVRLGVELIPLILNLAERINAPADSVESLSGALDRVRRAVEMIGLSNLLIGVGVLLLLWGFIPDSWKQRASRIIRRGEQEPDSKAPIRSLCDQLDSLPVLCSDMHETDTIKYAGTLVSECVDAGSFSAEPGLERRLRMARDGKTSDVVYRVTLPTGDQQVQPMPDFAVFFVAASEAHRRINNRPSAFGEALTSVDMSKEGAFLAAQEIARYIRLLNRLELVMKDSAIPVEQLDMLDLKMAALLKTSLWDDHPGGVRGWHEEVSLVTADVARLIERVYSAADLARFMDAKPLRAERPFFSPETPEIAVACDQVALLAARRRVLYRIRRGIAEPNSPTS